MYKDGRIRSTTELPTHVSSSLRSPKQTRRYHTEQIQRWFNLFRVIYLYCIGLELHSMLKLCALRHDLCSTKITKFERVFYPRATTCIIILFGCVKYLINRDYSFWLFQNDFSIRKKIWFSCNVLNIFFNLNIYSLASSKQRRVQDQNSGQAQFYE